MNNLRKQLVSQLGMFPADLNRIIATAPHRYKVFHIPKKKPGEYRRVAQPAYELKVIQNKVVEMLKDVLPVHRCAVAYREGMGIKHNASQHVGRRYALKMDFRSFFPSIKKDDLIAHIEKHAGEKFTDAEVQDLCNLLLWAPKDSLGRCLCIGAPSSPFVSNSIMYEFDDSIHELCCDSGVVYTRYADDLIFTTNKPGVLSGVEAFVREYVHNLKYPKLSLNEQKTVHTSKGRGISVTGLNITPENKLSIGRDRKRLIRAGIHRFINGDLAYKEVQRLNGLLAFAHDVEPEFVERMKTRYGADFLKRIQARLAEGAG